MRMGHFFPYLAVALSVFGGYQAQAQDGGKEITVDYSNPKQYVVGGISVEGNKYILYTPSNEEIECKIVSNAEEPIVKGRITNFSFSLADYKGDKLYDFPTLIWMKISGINGNVTLCGEVDSEYKEFRVSFSDINESGFKSGTKFYTL